MADVDILDFGADPTGVTDSTAAVQSALDTGNSVFIPDGTYLVSSLVVAASGIRIYGKGVLKKAEIDGILLILSGAGNLLDGLSIDGYADNIIKNHTNDILRITGDGNVIRNCVIEGSAGGGIAILGAARNQVLGNIIRNVNDNSVLVGGAGADDNLLMGNYCEGTFAQNNIFLTADSSSSPTSAFIYRNKVIGNLCKGAADTAIEIGQHNRCAIVDGNYAQGSVNPPILIRDSLDWIVIGNVVDCGDCTDGIAVVPQNEPASLPARGSIVGNRVVGRVARSYVYLGNYDVKVSSNFMTDTVTAISPDGSNLSAAGILVAGSVNNVEIRGNTVSGVHKGISTHLVPSAVDNFVCADNDIAFTNMALDFTATTILSGSVSGNTFRRCVAYGINLDGGSGNYSTALCRNVFNLEGFVGATPIGYHGGHSALRTFLASETERSAAIPVVQYSAVVLVPEPEISAGVLSLEFGTGEFAILAIYPQVGSGDAVSYSAIKNSAEIHMTSTGFSDWAVTKASYGIILQRRGGSVPARGQFKWRYEPVTSV